MPVDYWVRVFMTNGSGEGAGKKGDNHIRRAFKPFPVALTLALLILLGTVWILVNHYQKLQMSAFGSVIQEQKTLTPASSVDLNCKVGKDLISASCYGQLNQVAPSDSLQTADLKAQQDMSAWAFGMLWVSGIGLMLSALGVWFIWETLKSTRAALVEAKNATKAAEATVRVTEDSARRQLRAYLIATPKGLTLTATGDVSALIQIKNTGQTPAYRIRNQIVFYKAESIASFVHPEFENSLSGGPTLGTNVPLSITVSFLGANVTTEEIARNSRGELAFLVCGRVWYKNVFEEELSIDFIYAYQNGNFAGGSAGIIL
jgi:hypothetical protein